MGKFKETTSRSSCLLKRLELHNQSPSLAQDERLQNRQGEDEGHTDGGRRSRSNSAGREGSERVHRSSRDRSSQRREPRSRRDSRPHDRSRLSHSHSSRGRSASGNDEHGGTGRRHSSRSNDNIARHPSRSDEPPAWAKAILENQEKTAQDILRLQSCKRRSPRRSRRCRRIQQQFQRSPNRSFGIKGTKNNMN